MSKEKRRFKDEKYDLDLTYINDKIIAMGFPSSDFEASYRNDADDVYNFFEERHRDHYKFYNLCSERAYPAERFHGRVAHFPFDDHNPPPLGMFLYFCQDVEGWLAQDDRNVAAIHCKAGKGRTGVMITAFLMYAKEWEEPEDAMSFYGFARTNNQKGITIPSQRTFIFYWNKMLKATAQFEDQTTALRRTSIFASTKSGGVDGDSADDLEGANLKDQIAKSLSHLKEDGEIDDSDSEGEDGVADSGGGTQAPPTAPGEEGTASLPVAPESSDAAAEAAAEAAALKAAETQLSQLLSLKEAGHLSQAEYDEAVKHVQRSQEAAKSAASATARGGGGNGPAPEGAVAVAGAAAVADDDDSPDEDEEELDEASSGGKGGKGSMMKRLKVGSSNEKVASWRTQCNQMNEPVFLYASDTSMHFKSFFLFFFFFFQADPSYLR